MRDSELDPIDKEAQEIKEQQIHDSAVYGERIILC